MARRRIDASHVIAYQDGGHRHLRDGVVVTDGSDIVHVGPQGSWNQPVDETIDASGMVVTPGFINTHTHLYESPLDKSFVEDMGRRQFYLSGLFEYLPVRSMAMDEEAAHACLAYSMAELLRTGTTTVMEIGSYGEEAVRQAGRVGMRLYMGLGYRSGRWYTDDGKEVKYAWDEEAGLRGHGARGPLHRGARRRAERPHQGISLAVAGRYLHRGPAPPIPRGGDQHGRAPGAAHLAVGQRVPGDDPPPRRDADRVAARHRLSRAGRHPRPRHHRRARDAGRTGRATTSASWPTPARTSPTAVWVFARRGIAMESFARYLARGVNMTLGTDTCPQSMIEGLRYTAVVGKIVDRQTEVATAADVFNAATLGGAKALGRDDLGRIAPGAKADLLLWRGDSLFMTPLRDPIRNIVYSATAEDLDTVLIDGEVRMRGREIPGVDVAALTRDLQAAGERMWANVNRGDWAGRTIDELAPQTFPAFEQPVDDR